MKAYFVIEHVGDYLPEDQEHWDKPFWNFRDAIVAAIKVYDDFEPDNAEHAMEFYVMVQKAESDIHGYWQVSGEDTDIIFLVHRGVKYYLQIKILRWLKDNPDWIEGR